MCKGVKNVYKYDRNNVNVFTRQSVNNNNNNNQNI